ncbi:hypothetical protein CI15_06260 [Paraburkholderia monticola]|uniref:Restriction endonuclease type IV Mrr domain-containing protein n=1 Tax=Paraburkholderia monticola TaxID=1399968 RepID=A0A149PXQ6_9BURK|nr:restriction endonuclease [Paraburkholderia monticola]KXU89789.1 hypothetical protein CI15_06260 [Paraburkholderia monticola]
MTAAWQTYQQEVAELFVSLGCTVEVEKEAVGARGLHVVDVLARATFAGVAITWVVECKLWNTAIPKEKVLALAQIASDIGADRAFLLSESGFQAGAIRVAEHTNITLTNMQELLGSAKSEIQRRELISLTQKANQLQREMHDFFILNDYSPRPPKGADRESFLDLLAVVFELCSIALPRALAGEFPIKFSTGDSLSTTYDATTFIADATRELSRVTNCLEAAKLKVEGVRNLAAKTFVEFALNVGEFLDASETVLATNSQAPVDQKLLTSALHRMVQVGQGAASLRVLVNGKASRTLSRVTRALSDGPYIYLAEMHRKPDQWRQSRETIETLLRELAAFLSAPVTPQT